MITPAHAQIPTTVIRDTEIENTLKTWMEPLLKAAGMGPNSVNIILVQSPDINAFVAGGANIFIYTGLINKTETPEEVIGVLAHELGHITGGHLIRARAALERASYEAILGAVLGIGAAVLGGGSAGSAIIAGSQSIAQRNYLAHSRVNESSADQAALTYMDKSGINPKGLASFLEKLGANELIPQSRQDEYARTHPITSNRIEALSRRIESSPHAEVHAPALWQDQHKRMKAKLLGFIDPDRVVWTYNDLDQSIPARYAHAIAAYRHNDTDQALKLMDELLLDEPKNPYFLELKGQMLVDFGQVDEGVKYYKQSVSYNSKSGLIRMNYGHALLETGHTEDAITQLQRALIAEPRSTRIHRLLARAYGQQGAHDKAALHLAEEALLQRKLPQAHRHIQTALKTLEKNTPLWIRAQDTLQQIERLEESEN